MDLGNNIKRHRELKGLTQEELAQKSGLSKNAIWNYENNHREPNIKTIENIAAALEVGINQLISDTDFNVSQTLGDKIRAIRKDRKLTQKEFGELIGKAEITIRKYEKGDVTPPLDVVLKIGKKLGSEISDLLLNEFIYGIDEEIREEYNFKLTINPKFKSMLVILDNGGFKVIQDSNSNDVSIFKESKVIKTITEDNFIKFSDEILKSIKDYTEFQVCKVIDQY